MGLNNNSPVVLTVVTSGTSFARSFSVKVTQIECDSLSKGDYDNYDTYPLLWFLHK